ncbi:hypothetical protein Cgig2_012059 [Carnegiea gigantea]|uniref:RING-type domain-containing protein n=1 Tax=Carnegiea gigantea TaxID=171969 RepID=A0A9Q1KS68_9CARY|nr:hypothetical protein Cgig2_012059 [Carnegiea gigantea]
MSTRVRRGAPSMGTGFSSQRGKIVLDIDINTPPCENLNEVGTSSCGLVHPEAESAQQVAPLQPISIDVDALDDDVILCSPRAFAEAKNKARRNQGRGNVVDVELESQVRRNKRRRAPTNQSIINCDSYINLDGNGNTVQANGENLSQQPGGMMQPHPPPQEPTFSCPVCMGPFVEETSTKCGHIFCKACIRQSIGAQGKCPTCRKKITMKTTFRVYLPATRLS